MEIKHKNAIIINGVHYAAKRKMPETFKLDDACDHCDLKRRCQASYSGNFCAPFEKNGFIPYFKKINP
jgi:hypothetical protein